MDYLWMYSVVSNACVDKALVEIVLDTCYTSLSYLLGPPVTNQLIFARCCTFVFAIASVSAKRTHCFPVHYHTNANRSCFQPIEST